MKSHIKAFFISIVLVFAGGILSKYLDLKFSLAMVEQAKSISYFVTLAGIVTAFSWYKRTATSVVEGESETPPENVVKQKRILLYLVIINFLNAAVLLLSTEESIQLMAGMSLLVVVISPIIFRTMQEKDAMPPKEDEIKAE